MKKISGFILNISLSLVVFLILYICTELFLAPVLSKRGILPIREFYFVQNVDHKLPKNDKIRPTNSDSIRDLRESNEFKKNGNNIIILGDSFVYGYTKYENTIPVMVENELKKRFPSKDIKVANFGWISSSPFLSYRKLQRIGHTYHPKIIILCIDMTDFHDDIKYQLMLNKKGIYWFYDKIPITLGVIKNLFPNIYWKIHRWSIGKKLPRQRFFMSENPLLETEKYFKDIMRNIEKINKYAKEQKTEFILIIFPRHYQYNAKESPNNWEKGQYTLLGSYSTEPFRYFDGLKSIVDFPIYSLLEDFQKTKIFPTTFNDDPHWNEAGNRVAANKITRILKSRISD